MGQISDSWLPWSNKQIRKSRIKPKELYELGFAYEASERLHRCVKVPVRVLPHHELLEAIATKRTFH